MPRPIHFASLFLVAALCAPAFAQEAPDTPQEDAALAASAECSQGCSQNCSQCCDPEDSFWTRSTLTGDWVGFRSRIQERGVTFAGRSTHFAFGVDGGVTASPVPALAPGDTFLYTGRGEYDTLVDLQKFGGLPHGKLLMRLEHWYGEYGNVSFRTGGFSPAVFPAATPPVADSPGELFVTNFLITQPLSEKFVAFIGKKDVLGGVDQNEFAGGDGTDQFVNQAFVANPAFLLGLPYTGFIAGVALPRKWGMMTAFVRDPKDRTQSFFDVGNLFAHGVILGGQVEVNTTFLQRPGEVHLGGMWKHVDLTDLRFNEPPPGVYPEPTVPGFPTLPDSYTIFGGFDQYIVEFSGEPQRKGWGVFGRASISDGNPTPIRYFLSGGLGGYSRIRPGKDDRWGLAAYFVGASHEFGPIPQALFGPRDGTGVEAFYNFQVNPWLNVSPDVQYIHPEAGAIADDSVVYGVRVNVKL